MQLLENYVVLIRVNCKTSWLWIIDTSLWAFILTDGKPRSACSVFTRLLRSSTVTLWAVIVLLTIFNSHSFIMKSLFATSGSSCLIERLVRIIDTWCSSGRTSRIFFIWFGALLFGFTVKSESHSQLLLKHFNSFCLGSHLLIEALLFFIE